MKFRLISGIFAVASLVAGLSLSAQSLCKGGVVLNDCNYVDDGNFYNSSAWTMICDATTDHTSETMCSGSRGTFVKMTGACGHSATKQSFTTYTAATGGSYFGMDYTVEMTNTHSHSGNYVYYLVRNITDSTSEIVDTITGASGDVWCDTRSAYLYRPDWVGKVIEIEIVTQSADSDHVAKITQVGFHQALHS